MPYERTEIVRPKGINKDLSPYELPADVWSDGENINFRRKRTNKSRGYRNPWALTDSVAPPTYALFFTDADEAFWAYASFDSIYKTDGTTAVALGTGYLADRANPWTGNNFNSLIYLNNRNNIPQVIDPAAAKLKTYGAMIDMPNWGTQAADSAYDPADNDGALYPWTDLWRASVIRPYKNYLFAMDCFEGTTDARWSSMVRWSSPCSQGDVPPSWDATSPSEGAGEYNLADSPGRICDGQTLGDYFVIYKVDAVWLVQFVGGDFVFSFRKLFGDDAGILTTDCMAEFEGKHFVLSPTGAYVHNAATKQEIMDPWVKDIFFDDVSLDSIKYTKVVADHNNKEIWVYYIPEEDYVDETSWATKALVWNWEIAEWTIKSFNNHSLAHVAEGVIVSNVIAPAGEDWDSDNQAWNEDTTIWNTNAAGDVSPTEEGILLCDYTNQVFYKNGLGGTQAGIPLPGFVERIGIDFNDDQSFKYISRIVPHILGQNPITVKIYAEDVQTSSPTLQGTYVFQPTEDQAVDCHITGRYIGVRFESDDLWTLTGYTIEWEPSGIY